jgi:hypothetical protein
VRKSRPLLPGLVAAALLLPAAASSSSTSGVERDRVALLNPSAAKLVPRDGVLLGAYVNPDDVWRGNEAAFATVQRFESLLGRPLAIDLHFYDWRDVFPSGLEEWDIAHGRIPMVSWKGTGLSEINSGRHDALIRQRAREIKALGAPVFLRWGWEMNGDWFAHSGSANMPNGPAKFVLAWRRIHRIFTAVGASNAVWFWCANAENAPNERWNSWRNYYPGDAYVDWVGIDGYNWGTTRPWSRWQSFADIIRPIYRDYASRKPIMVAETASAEAGGDKAAWIRAADDTLRREFPSVRAFVWFEVLKETDWRAESSEASLAAFRSLAQHPYFAAR